MNTIDDIITQAQASITALFDSGEISLEAKTFMCAQFARLRLEFKSIEFALEEKPLTAADFLRAGIKHMDARGVTHDAPNGERSMLKTVSAFNIICDQDLSEEEGWMFMGLLKKVRSVQGRFNKDNYEDGASYEGLRGECASRDRAK